MMKTIREIDRELFECTTLEALSETPYGGDGRKGVMKLLEKHRRRIEKTGRLMRKYDEMNEYENGLGDMRGMIAGVDEAGRGPIAGEVVAAAVVLPEDFMLLGLDDSKKLSLKKRLEFREVIMDRADYGIGVASVEEIDRLNIYAASRLAMERAVSALEKVPRHLLVDAMTIGNGIPETSIVKGDARSVSIAAASVLAKTERDMMMAAYEAQYPGYGFSGHKGYGTKSHLDALARLGAADIHRRTFEPVKNIALKK